MKEPKHPKLTLARAVDLLRAASAARGAAPGERSKDWALERIERELQEHILGLAYPKRRKVLP